MNVQEKARLFHRDGFVKLPGLISPEELRVLQEDTQRIVDGPYEDVDDEIDYFAGCDPETGETVFHRVQYIFPKSTKNPNAFLALLGHPRVLALVQALLGDQLLCDGEALVFKKQGNGKAVPVHADCNPGDPRMADEHLTFNVDFYLDDSTMENGCLLAAPGSHTRREPIEEIAKKGFDYPGLEPVPMKAGDVLFHNVRVVHGSHKSRSDKLRRTIYYEFQALPWIRKEGVRPDHPVTEEWTSDRIRLMLHAVEERKKCAYADDETPFEYHVPKGFRIDPPSQGSPINLRPKLGYSKYF